MTSEPGDSDPPVIDPTQNVLDLVEAAVKRLDDIRELESRHVREILEIRAEHFKELRELERMRIDAIRSVDIAAVNRATEVASTVAQTLADQVRQAEKTADAKLDAVTSPIRADIADLRRAQYEQAGGKAQVVEGRDVRSEMRLNAGAIIAGLGTLVALLSLAVFIIVSAR